MLSSTLTSKGQTTLPKEVRDTLGLAPGDRIRWILAGDEVLILRVRTLDEVGGSLAKYTGGPARTVDEMDAGIGAYMAAKFGPATRDGAG